MALIRIELKEGLRAGGRGLLFPIPPDTLDQRLAAMRVPDGWEYEILQAENFPQKALWVKSAPSYQDPVEFELEEGAGSADAWNYRPFENEYSRLPADIREKCRELLNPSLETGARIDAIAAFVHGYMSYTSCHWACDPHSPTPATAFESRKGNCLDINTLFLSLLFAAEIPASYNIGYFFPTGSSETDDWHCWVTIQQSWGLQDWDIPQHLMADAPTLQPGLDAIPGRRYIFSRGRGLVFRVAGASVELSHFGMPKCIDGEGRLFPVPFSARLQTVSQAVTVPF